MKTILLFILIPLSLCADTKWRVYTSTSTVEFKDFTKATVYASSVNADSIVAIQWNPHYQFEQDSIYAVKQKNILTTLQNLYNTNVVGTDARNLTTTQQRITLGVILMNLGMIDTNFKMK